MRGNCHSASTQEEPSFTWKDVGSGNDCGFDFSNANNSLIDSLDNDKRFLLNGSHLGGYRQVDIGGSHCDYLMMAS